MTACAQPEGHQYADACMLARSVAIDTGKSAPDLALLQAYVRKRGVKHACQLVIQITLGDMQQDGSSAAIHDWQAKQRTGTKRKEMDR